MALQKQQLYTIEPSAFKDITYVSFIAYIINKENRN